MKVREKPTGSGVWWVFIDHEGDRKAKKIGKDKKLAQEVARKIEAKLTMGDVGLLKKEDQDKGPTLREYVLGWKDDQGKKQLGWFDKQGKLALKRSTCVSYESVLKTHILPELGNTHLADITSRMIADFIVSRLKAGLRSQTARNIKYCLSSIMSYARQPDGYIESNPVTDVKVARPEDERASREPDPFPWEDRTTLEKTFKEHFPRYYPMILTGFRTGLRLGELVALQWGDIDFKHRIIRVTRNMAAGRITTPKSKSSIREVRMTSQLIEELKWLRNQNKAETLKRGWSEVPDWLFYNEAGNPLNGDNWRKRVWDRAMEKSELRRRTPHD